MYLQLLEDVGHELGQERFEVVLHVASKRDEHFENWLQRRRPEFARGAALHHSVNVIAKVVLGDPNQHQELLQDEATQTHRTVIHHLFICFVRAEQMLANGTEDVSEKADYSRVTTSCPCEYGWGKPKSSSTHGFCVNSES